MWAVARRPRWIALLLLAIILAGVFAALGKWQLERSIENGKPLPASTETRKTLDDVTTPEKPVGSALAGQKVTVSGRFVAGDTTVLTGRSGGWPVPDRRPPGRRRDGCEPPGRDRLVRPAVRRRGRG
ncbi:SURF1 family cytochrome oxidase biogenesis protein [Curtobacterium sp. MCPF17_052]|uniref:SURF1 family cytochrome oxidase biogenesis protein n=1 Tax=Curtobacterium sp. MCPF17_052 TaxID=2175655 RepID=UPI0024DFE81A|nr:SURF1 family cytochrome oxidase biogenesis protein [Curtobacterium sp. MCPF17_052]WIB13648.1 SURF1 family cytochrome oxidase biogenesis protein [Curtobacterium sp. MCPF17_052]